MIQPPRDQNPFLRKMNYGRKTFLVDIIIIAKIRPIVYVRLRL